MAATIQIIANLQNNAASPIKALRSDIEGLGDGADKASSGFSRLQSVGAAATGALVSGVTAATVAVGAFMVKGVQMAADMEAQVSNIAAAWGTTADAISPVADLIQDLGLDPNLKVTAVEAAQAIEMLAKNGMTMDQVLQGAAHSTVLLANATGADFNTAANIATDVMALFGIQAADMKTAVDGVTSVTVASKFAIDDYALALAQGGGVAAQMGVSFADFNTSLVATSAYFKSGSDAGTSFKTFLQRLIPTTNEAEDLMRSLGLITDETGNRFYDAQGNMKSMGEIAGILNSTFKDMTEAQRNAAMATLFGTDAMRFAAGIAGYSRVEFEKLQKVMGNTDALEQAKTRVDNFRGAWEIFTGVISGLQLQIGSALLPMLRLLVEFLTGQLVNVGSNLIDVFERIVEAFNMFVESLQEGHTPLQALMGLVQQIGLAFGLTMEQATNLGNAVAGVVGVIVSVGTAVTSFVGQFLSWKDVLLGIAISIASFLLPILGTLAGGFLTLISPLLATIAVVALLRAAWESNFLGIQTAVNGLVETVGKVIAVFTGPGGLFDNLSSGQSVTLAVGQALGNLALALGLPVDAAGNLVRGFIVLSESVQSFINTLSNGGSLADAFMAGLTTLQEGIFNWAGASSWGEVGSMILDQIAGAFASLGDRAGEAAANILNWITTAVNSIDWQAVGETVVNGIAAVIAAAVGGLVVAGTAITNFFSGFFTNDSLQAAGQGLITALGNAISGAATGISTALDGIRQAIFDWAGGDSWGEVGGIILDRIGEAFRNLGDRVAEVQAGIFNWIAGGINGVDWANVGQTLINALAAAVTGALGLLAAVGTAIINYFVGFFSNPDVGPAAQNLITALANAITGLASGIGTGLQSIWTAITTYFAGIDWSGVGQTILTGISNALSSAGIDPEKILGPITNIFSEIERVFAPLFERLKEAFGGLGETLAPLGDKLSTLKDSFGRLGEAVQPVLSVLGTLAGYVAAVFGLIAGVIGAAIGVVANFLGNVLAGIIDNAGKIIGGLVTVFTGIVDLITNEIETIVNIVRAIFEGDWQAVWDGAVAGVTGFLESVRTILGGLVEIIDGIMGTVWDAIVNTINDLTGATLPSWEEFKSGVVQKFTEAKEGIVTAVEGWKEAITSKIEEIKSSITTTVEGWKTAIVDGVAQIKEAISSKIEEWKEAITSKIEEIKSSITTTVDGWKTAIVDGIASIAESIREKVSEWAESFSTFIDNVREINIGETIVEYIVSGLETFVTNVGATLSGWFNAFTSWVSGIDWYDVGYTIVDFILTALIDFPQEVASTLAEWAQAFWDWATDTASELQDSASEIIDSIIEGLKEFPGEVADTLQEWVQAFIDWATDTAGEVQDTGTTIIEAVIEGLKEFPGKVADTLQEWVQAFIDWATDTADEVRDTGTTIIESVIEGLKEFPAKVADTLREWVQAFIDWATDTAGEVQDTGTTIIESVIEGLKEFPGQVADTLQEWTQAFWDWVTNTASELQDTGRQIIDAIITGLKEFPTLVADTLRSWITAFATWVGSSIAQLVIIGTAIITHIIAGLAAFWEKAVTTVSGWFTSLSTYISTKIAELIALGSSIVEGIITGIQNMAQAVIDAAGAVIQGGIDAIRARLGNPHSPAPALIPLGSSISEGVAAGILGGAGFVMDALGQLASQIQVEGAKAFGEAMKALAEGLAAGLNAILDLSAFPGVGGSFLDNLRSVVEMLAQMVAEVSRANTYGEEALKLLGAFVDVAGGIADLILPLIVALTEIGHFQPPGAETFTAAMAQLALYLSMTVAHVAAANQYSTVVLEGLSSFLDVMQQIASTVGPFLAALVDINAFGTVDLWFFHEGIAHLWYTMLMVVQKVQELAVLGEQTLARMEGFLSVVQAMADTIGPFIAALFELNAFGTVDLWFFHEGLAQLAYVMVMVVGAIAEANTFGQIALDGVKLFAETAGAIADLIGPMIEGLISINALDGTMNEVAYHAVYFRNGVRALVDALASAAQLFTSGTLQHVQLFAETAGAIADIIGPAVEGLMIIGTLTGDLNYIGVQATYFRNGLRTIVSALESAAQLFTAAILNQVQLFAETAGKIMEVIAPAIEGFALIATLTGDVNYIGIQATYLRNGLRTIVTAISSAAELFTAGLLQHTQLFAETAGAIVELIAEAIEALALLAGYVAAAGLEAAAASFAADLTAVINIIVDALQTAGILANEAISQAGELADGLSDILGLVEDGIDALVALAAYVTASGFEESAHQFAEDLVFVITTVVDALVQGGILSNAALVAAGELADAIGDLMGAIEDGVEGLITLSTYMTNTNLQSTAEAFAADLALVLLIIADALSQAGVLSSEAFQAAAELSDSVVDLVKMIAEGVEALMDLSGYGSMEDLPIIAEQFARDLAIVLETVIAALQEAGVLVNIGVVQAGELGDAMKDLLAAIGEGVDALTDLAGYTAIQNLNAIANQFAVDLAAVIITVANALLEAGVLASQGVAAAGGLSAGLKELLGVIGEGVGVLTALGDFVAAQGLNEKVRAFAADLAMVIVTVSEALRDAGVLASQAVAFAGIMAENLTNLLDVIDAGIEALTAVAEYTSVNGLQAKISAFAADLATLTISLATALSDAASRIDQEAMTAAAQFATDAAAIADAVSKALDSLAAIAEADSLAGLDAKIAGFAAILVSVTTLLASALSTAAAQIGQEAIAAAAKFATDSAAILGAVNEALVALTAIGEHQLAQGLSAKIQAFAQELINITTFLALGLGAAAAQLGSAIIAAAVQFANNAAAVAQAVDTALGAIIAITENNLADGAVTKIQNLGTMLVIVATILAMSLAAASQTVNSTIVAMAIQFANNATGVAQAVDTALEAIAALAGNNLADGAVTKIQSLGTLLVIIATVLAMSLAAASQTVNSTVVAMAVQFANNAQAVAQAVNEALQAVAAIAANGLADGTATKIQSLGATLVIVATVLAYTMAAAAQAVSPAIVGLATQFTTAVTALSAEVRTALTALNQLASLSLPNIQPVLAYIVASSQQIQAAFTAAGSIGQAVQYAETFRQNLEQLVREVQLALAQLDALARGNAPGSVQAILDAMVNALRNSVGDFNGAGEALASAVEDGFRSGDFEGAGQDAGQDFISGLASQEGAAVNALEGVLSAMLTMARNYAANFAEVGRLITAALTSGIQSTAQQVTSAVLTVLQAAINAGRTLIGNASQLGTDLGRAAAEGMSSTRSMLDAAGSSAGSSLIEGLRRAIANGQSSIVNQIIATVRAAIQAAENALGIHSPSRVFYRIGEFLIDGFRRGIEVGVAPVIRAVAHMARQVSDTVESGLTVSVPSVRLAGSMLPAPVSMSSMSPRFSVPAPVMTPLAPSMRSLPAAGGAGDMYVANDIQVSVTFPNGTSASAADIKKAIQSGIEEAMLNAGRRADASRRLR